MAEEKATRKPITLVPNTFEIGSRGRWGFDSFEIIGNDGARYALGVVKAEVTHEIGSAPTMVVTMHARDVKQFIEDCDLTLIVIGPDGNAYSLEHVRFGWGRAEIEGQTKIEITPQPDLKPTLKPHPKMR